MLGKYKIFFLSLSEDHVRQLGPAFTVGQRVRFRADSMLGEASDGYVMTPEGEHLRLIGVAVPEGSRWPHQ